MTKQELNRDINRMYKKLIGITINTSGDDYFKSIERDIKPEFMRLYYADKHAEYMNLKNFKIMIKMNHTHRFVNPHLLFNDIKI